EVDAPVVDRRNVAAGEREQVADALVLQRLRDKVSAVSGLFHRRRPRGRGPDNPSVDAPARANHLSDWRSYDSVAEIYEPHRGSAVTDPEARDLVALSDPPAGGRVLDVGTGTGIALELARAAVGDDGLAVGVDLSVAMLRQARKLRPSLSVAAADAVDLPF